MPTLVRDPQPMEFEALLERRRKLGQDLLDEVWDGIYHKRSALIALGAGELAERIDWPR